VGGQSSQSRNRRILARQPLVWRPGLPLPPIPFHGAPWLLETQHPVLLVENPSSLDSHGNFVNNVVVARPTYAGSLPYAVLGTSSLSTLGHLHNKRGSTTGTWAALPTLERDDLGPSSVDMHVLSSDPISSGNLVEISSSNTTGTSESGATSPFRDPPAVPCTLQRLSRGFHITHDRKWTPLVRNV